MTALVMIVLGGVLLVVPSSRWRLTERRWVLPALPIPSRRRTASASVVEVLAGLRDELEAGSALRPAFERAVQATGDPAFARTRSPCAGWAVTYPRPCAKKAPSIRYWCRWPRCGRSRGSGAALASALDRLVGAARQSAKLRREVAAQLAGPRGTVRVLAVLPAVGVGMEAC